jgi:hypothetical protein
LAGLTNLESLSIESTAVTDKGLVHLSRMTNLEDLSLNGTKVTATGIENLQKSLPACEIRHRLRVSRHGDIPASRRMR